MVKIDRAKNLYFKFYKEDEIHQLSNRNTNIMFFLTHSLLLFEFYLTKTNFNQKLST